mgnify:CR=1 FL=1
MISICYAVRKLSLLILCTFAIIFVSESATAGSIGTPIPAEGEDWEIDEYTYVWDETIIIHDWVIKAESTGNLKLDNVILYAEGNVEFEKKVEIFNSNITINKQDNEDGVSISDTLDIRNSSLSLNSSLDHFFNATNEGIGLLGDSAYLSITDNSLLYSSNFNLSKAYYTAIEIWANSGNSKVRFENSTIKHLGFTRSMGDNTIVRGNHFDYCRSSITSSGVGFRFTDNFVDRGWWESGSYQVYLQNAEGAVISNNTFNLTYDTIGVEDSNNITVENNIFKNTREIYAWSIYGVDSYDITVRENHFQNHSGSPIVFMRVNDSLIERNTFFEVFGPDNVWVSGINNKIINNTFDYCGSKVTIPAGYGITGCIEVTKGGYSNNNVNLFGSNWIEDNTITNFSGSAIVVAMSSIIIEGNTIINGTPFGFQDAAAVDTYTFTGLAPSDVFIRDNYIEKVDIGVYLDGSVQASGGSNIIVERNIFSMSDKGIYLITNGGGSYQGTQIFNNTIIDNLFGIEIEYGAGIIIENNSLSGLNGIEVKFSTNLAIGFNQIESHYFGIRLNNSVADIYSNQIIASCKVESCEKIGFTKVGDIGLDIIWSTDINILDNVIKKYAILVNTRGSELYFDNNSLDFTNIGYNSNHDEIQIWNGKISNVSNGIQLFEANLSLVSNEFKDFGTGIKSFNSSLDNSNNIFANGVNCYDLTDSIYTLDSFDGWDCSGYSLNEYFNVRVFIGNLQGTPVSSHEFWIIDSQEDYELYGKTSSNGYSKYSKLINKTIDSNGYQTLFNPYKFYYEHNSIITSVEKEVLFNQTVSFYLDTLPPQTEIYGNATLVNSEIFYLNINVSNDEDVFDFDIEYIVNDGENFAEWQLYGTFNQSIVKFVGEDSTKYRFRSIGRDMFGNEEIKTTYDFEISVDTKIPNSNFIGIQQDYIFTDSKQILLGWSSDSDDIQNYYLVVKYTNFTDEYLDPDSVVWADKDNFIIPNNDPFLYELSDIGHYSFKITSLDIAGNLEEKDGFDFIINYDSQSDSINLVNVPERWGYNSMTIDYVKANEYLDFDLYLSIETTVNPSETLMWFMYEYDTSSNDILLSSLQDSSRYYLVAKSRDLAGNLEDPLNSTERFVSNGEYDQIYDLRYIPLEKSSYPIIVNVDEDGDGIFEITLLRGNNLTKLQNNQYFLDSKSKILHFGGLVNGGYVPELGDNISISYAGVNSIFEVYTQGPDPADTLEIVPTNASYITFYFEITDSVAQCKVQRTTDLASGWYNEKLIEPCGTGTYAYVERDPDPEKNYYYRVYSEDEFGHSIYSDEIALNMEEIVLLYDTSGSNDISTQFGMEVIIPVSILAGLVLIAGGVMLFTTRKEDILDENVNVIESKPVAKYKLEELYLIYSDGRLVSHVSDVENEIDSDIMSGMLTAINDFVQDSFSSQEDLGSIDYGQNKIVLQRGANYYLAAVVYGETDNFFKGKLANIIRALSIQFPHLKEWDGDASQNEPIDAILKPLMDETATTNREMVDNYIADIQVSITSQETVTPTSLSLNLNFSNYSTNNLNLGTVKPIFNDQYLILTGMKPDILYSFTDNKFHIGEIKSYTEVQIELNFKKKVTGLVSVDLEFSYFVKDKLNTTTKRVFDGKV